MGIRSHFQRLLGESASTAYYGSNVNRSTYAYLAASGGIEIPASTSNNGYQYHVFTTPGTFSVTSTPIQNTANIEYFVIAGGGGGGTGTGGGGGAGGVRVGIGTVSVGNYSVTVGAGAAPSSYGNVSNNGNPSFISGISSATAGGRGASGAPFAVNAASPGGSGGGGMTYPSSPPQVTGGSGNAGGYTPVEGYAGADGPGGIGGGGGGGAGGVGLLTPTGTGGVGTFISACASPIISPAIPAPVRPSWVSAVTQGYFGGGGGGSYPNGTAVPGGQGGGGASAVNGGASPGVEYTGSGGGANWTYTNGYTAGGGGSGIVVVRYRSGNQPTVIGYKTTFTGTTQWFNPGYFGVEVHPDYRLENNYTYSSVTYRRVNVGSYYWWLLISQKTGLNTYTPVYGALIQTPSGGTTGETLIADFSSASSTFGSATVPANGDYYISWLSTAPGFTAPTGSIYVDSGSGGFINYVLTSTAPNTGVVYTTTSGNSANRIHISVS